MSARPIRTLITIVMNVLVVVAVLLTAALVIRFFGAFAATGWGKALVRMADLVTLPAGVADLKTPYGGLFDGNIAITVAVALLAEWVLAVFRGRL